MNELFIIYDHNTGKPLYYYITNNANGCKKALEFIDSLEYLDNWLLTFERQCEIMNIAIKRVDCIESYSH